MTIRRKLNYEKDNLFDNEMVDQYIVNYSERAGNNHTDTSNATQNNGVLPPVVTPQKANPYAKKNEDLKSLHAQSSPEKELFKSPADPSDDHISGARKKLDFK